MAVLDASASALRDYMSGLCRSAYGAEWADHLEFSLWHAVVQGPMQFGRIALGSTEITRLRELSDRCGGWVHVPRNGEPRCLPLNEWQDVYTSNVELLYLDAPVPPPGFD